MSTNNQFDKDGYVKPMHIASSVCQTIDGERVMLMVVDADRMGLPLMLDRSAAEDIAVNLLTCLMDMGVDLLRGDA